METQPPQKPKSTHEQQELAEMEGLLSRSDLLVEDRLKIQLEIKRKKAEMSMTKRPLGDITNLKRNHGPDKYKMDQLKSKTSEPFVSSTKATDLIRKSLSTQQSIPWKTTPKRLHVQVQTELVPLETEKENLGGDQESLYDWEVETLDEVKGALKETLKENEMLYKQVDETDKLKSRIATLEKELKDLENFHKATLETLKEETESSDIQERIYRKTIEILQSEQSRLLKELDESRNSNLLPDRRDSDVQTELDITLLLRSAKKALDQSDALTFFNHILQQEKDQDEARYRKHLSESEKKNVELEERLKRDTEFWKSTMSTNLHTLQQQMTEGLARSMTKCQDLENALRLTQTRNKILEQKFEELKRLLRQTPTGQSCEINALMSILMDLNDVPREDHSPSSFGDTNG